MKIVDRALDGLLVIEPSVFDDSRGSFFESFNKRKFFDLTGVEVDFVQDNHSVSKKNVVRGLHLQSPSFAQGKLVRVVSGSAYDVAVDIRKNSPTYGKHFGVELSSANNLLFWIPVGFAHGFSAKEEGTVFLYKCTNWYDKNCEMTIFYNDEDLKIDWKVENPIVSEKDKEGTLFKSFNSPF